MSSCFFFSQALNLFVFSLFQAFGLFVVVRFLKLIVLLFLSLSNLWPFCYSSTFRCNSTFQDLGPFVHSSFKLMVLLFVIGLIAYSFFKLSILLLYNSTSQAFGLVIHSFFKFATLLLQFNFFNFWFSYSFLFHAFGSFFHSSPNLLVLLL